MVSTSSPSKPIGPMPQRMTASSRGREPRDAAPPPFQRFPTWMWRNTVMPPLLKELQALNRDRAEGDMAGFYGLDIYNLSASINAVLAYLDRNDPEAAATARERYSCLMPWQSDPAIYGRASQLRGFAECEDAVVAQCRDLLENALDENGEGFSAAMNARLCGGGGALLPDHVSRWRGKLEPARQPHGGHARSSTGTSRAKRQGDRMGA